MKISLAKEAIKQREESLLPLTEETLFDALLHTEVLKFLDRPLHQSEEPPFQFDFSKLLTYPRLLQPFAEQLASLIVPMDADLIAGLAPTGVAIASYLSLAKGLPMVSVSHQIPGVAGDYFAGQRLLIIDDTAYFKSSFLDLFEALAKEGVQLSRALFLVDLEEGAKQALKSMGVEMEALISMSELLDTLYLRDKITEEQHNRSMDFVTQMSLNSV